MRIFIDLYFMRISANVLYRCCGKRTGFSSRYMYIYHLRPQIKDPSLYVREGHKQTRELEYTFYCPNCGNEPILPVLVFTQTKA